MAPNKTTTWGAAVLAWLLVPAVDPVTTTMFPLGFAVCRPI
ncbi:putative membrane protein [Mycobacterium xenopi 3993]|nr:putative membrane protein [Mycobacterium xenopi 3993]